MESDGTNQRSKVGLYPDYTGGRNRDTSQGSGLKSKVRLLMDLQMQRRRLVGLVKT